MRRILGLSIIGAAMLFATSAAQAGLRAIYLDLRQSKQLQIDVHDNGDARIGEVGSEDYGLLLGGEYYVVDIVDGKPMVARIKDIATAMDQVLPPIFKGLFDKAAAAMPRAELKIEPGEPGEAGGRKGRVYRIKGLDKDEPAKATIFLISDDPELKPMAVALEGFMSAMIIPAAPLIGNGATELIAETRTIFALGTPIDMGDRMRLNLAGKAAYPAAYFRLPAKPQSVGQLVAGMKASMEKGAAGK
jgi:hypothetical protein